MVKAGVQSSIDKYIYINICVCIFVCNQNYSYIYILLLWDGPPKGSIHSGLTAHCAHKATHKEQASDLSIERFLATRKKKFFF